jgi:hypothetical protein
MDRLYQVEEIAAKNQIFFKLALIVAAIGHG